MLPKLNWHSLCGTQKFLATTTKDNDLLVFTIYFKNGQSAKKNIQFKDFLKFFWHIYDSKILLIKDLIVTDPNNNLIYKYNVQNEQLPKESIDITVKEWNSLTNSQKETYLKILYAQLQFNK